MASTPALLKAALLALWKDNNLSTKGNKAELIQRLKDAGCYPSLDAVPTGRVRVLASPASFSSCRLFSLAIAIAMVRALVRAVPPGWRHDLLSLALCDACRSEKGTCWHEVFALARSLIREPQVVPTGGLGRILLPKPVI